MAQLTTRNSEGKLQHIRRVKEHVRITKSGNRSPVESYYQRYDKPRGLKSTKLTMDEVRAKSKTAWLKDSKGRFIGRANYKGKTSTRKSIASYGVDSTGNVRERGKYGRLYGRYKSGSKG